MGHNDDFDLSTISFFHKNFVRKDKKCEKNIRGLVSTIMPAFFMGDPSLKDLIFI